MKITDEHQYHGAALNQIAEDPHFTAINPFKHNRTPSRSAFQINDDIGVYLKICSAPNRNHEYVFNFSGENRAELERLENRFQQKVFLALVCVRAKEICCLPYSDFKGLLARREKEAGHESQFLLLMTVKEGEAFHVYVNQPGTRGQIIGRPKNVARNKFPKRLFE